MGFQEKKNAECPEAYEIDHINVMPTQELRLIVFFYFSVMSHI